MLNPVADRLDRYLSLIAARQQLAASNLANADTPGYKTRDIDFDGELARAEGQPFSRELDGLPVRNDGNNVSIDRESRSLAENNLLFHFAVQSLQSQIKLTRAAIQEGRS